MFTIPTLEGHFRQGTHQTDVGSGDIKMAVFGASADLIGRLEVANSGTPETRVVEPEVSQATGYVALSGVENHAAA